jgi:predicted dehydrogenase
MVKRALKFAVLGTGFWANYQIPAWFEVGGVELVALYNRTVSKAERMAQKFNVQKVYDDAEQLLQNETLDFIDIITEVPAHAPLVHLAAKYRVPVICQKPMGPDYETCQGMVRACQKAGVPLLIHENFRWQTPLRAVKHALVKGRIGRPFRARLQFINYISFDNQPSVKQLEHLILTDLGSHLLDLARFYFGEPCSLYCQHLQVRDDIAGEDVASVMLRIGEVICQCEMSFTSRTEWGHFPETLIYVEGTQGTLELGPDYWLRITTEQGTWAQRVPPPLYSWADPNYAVAHSSIVPCNRDLLRALKTGTPAETSAEDNLKTMRLVYAAYESAAADRVIHFTE